MKYLPCPFCGGLDLEVMEQILETGGCLGYGLTVYCDCGVQGAVAETEEEAISLWNTRADANRSTSEKAELTPSVKAKLYEGLEPYEEFKL